MLVSVVLGLLAGLAISNVIHLTADFWGNAGLWMLVGGAGAFVIDLLFVSPIRLWQQSEDRLRASQEDLADLRNAPPAGMRVEHVDTQLNIQVAAGGSLSIAASSNTVIVGQDREGILFPRGTIFQRGVVDWLNLADDATAVVQSMSGGDVSFVPPELLDQPPEPPGA